MKTDGGAEAGPGATVLAELAGLIADGHLEVPIANVYPLAQVREAYAELERRHTTERSSSGPNAFAGGGAPATSPVKMAVLPASPPVTSARRRTSDASEADAASMLP